MAPFKKDQIELAVLLMLIGANKIKTHFEHSRTRGQINLDPFHFEMGPKYLQKIQGE